MSVWQGKVWRMDRFSHKVIIISKILDGFNLANHGRFAKFAKLSRYTVVLVNLAIYTILGNHLEHTFMPIHTYYPTRDV